MAQMLGINFVGSLVLMSSLLTGAASGCRNKATRTTPSKGTTAPGELKLVAEGAHSSVRTPFIAVIRDADTYAALRRAADNLPEVTADTFKSNVLVAGFLGHRNTGGYSVEITQGAKGEIRVAEKAPGKDMMVSQMITAPFKLVLFPVSGAGAVSISADQTFQQTAQLYRIDKGSFTISGGFAGRSETYALAGKLQITRLGDLVSVGFAVVSTGAPRERSLRDVATGVTKNESFTIARMGRGSLVDPPSGDIHVTGRWVGTNRLILDLDTGPVTVPDGYQGKGRIEAVMRGAAN